MEKPFDPNAKRILKPENYTQGEPIPEIVVYSEENFRGEELRTNCDADFVGEKLNNKIKSIVIISGVWKFYRHAGFKHSNEGTQLINSYGNLSVGYYPNLESCEFKLKEKDEPISISSFQYIKPSK